MKNVFVLIMLAFLAMGQTCSQKDFEGSLTYELDLEGDFMGLMEAYMPDSYVFSFKEGKTLLRINGGLLESIMGKILIESEKSYIINDAEKSVYELSGTDNPEEIDADQQGAIITELNETETILGFECKKYEMLFNKGGNEYIQYVWATKEIGNRLNGLNESGVPGKFNFMGLDAFPLKIQSKISEGGISFSLLLTAVKIEKAKLDAKDFVIPDDYDVKALNDMLNFPK